MSENLKKYILERTNVPEPMFSITGILKACDMVGYAGMCCDRISESLLIDGKHVCIDYFNYGNLLIDKIGLIKCEDIFLNYVHREKINELEEYMFQLSNDVFAQNNYLESLRGFSVKIIMDALKETRGCNMEISVREEVIRHFKLEMISRCFLCKLWFVLRNKLRVTWLKLRHYPLIRLVERCAKDTMEKTFDEDISKEKTERPVAKHKWVLYLEAYEHFLERYEGKIVPEEISRDELKKYVYLGVKHLGSRTRDRRIGDVGKSHEDAVSVIQASGRLTPMELMQIFPVTKTYNGDRYDSKDYYFSMKAIQEHGLDKPIGNHESVVNLLWDYMNINILHFMVQWMDTISEFH